MVLAVTRRPSHVRARLSLIVSICGLNGLNGRHVRVLAIVAYRYNDDAVLLRRASVRVHNHASVRSSNASRQVTASVSIGGTTAPIAK